MAYYLGIDLGTTYTAAAAERDGVVESLTLGNRTASVPSVVYLRDDGEILVGEAATRRATTDPGRVAREFKRRVGDPTPSANRVRWSAHIPPAPDMFADVAHHQRAGHEAPPL